ncbi:MAG: hypothetical protein EOP06_29085 [Proteobacteria bacterium]|nr:MAG: hypothetical protein EOP06_29085 [Pseudomonadota bacterium]
MTKSLLALALVLSATSSAFAAPVKVLDTERATYIRAVTESIEKEKDLLNASFKANKNQELANCKGQLWYDMDTLIGYADEVQVDSNSMQPLLVFLDNPMASRAGETLTRVSVKTNASFNRVTSVQRDVVEFKEVQVGDLRAPKYALMPVTTSEVCELRLIPKAPKTTPAPKEKGVIKKGAVLQKQS